MVLMKRHFYPFKAKMEECFDPMQKRLDSIGNPTQNRTRFVSSTASRPLSLSGPLSSACCALQLAECQRDKVNGIDQAAGFKLCRQADSDSSFRNLEAEFPC